jgi:adenylate cyclase
LGGPFDGTLDEIFGLQDEVTTQVTAAVAPTVRAAKISAARRKGTDNVSGYDLYLQAAARLYESDTDGAIPLLARAGDLSPSFSPAYGLEAWSRTLWV